MFRKRWFWIAVVVLVLAVGGYFAYSSGWAGRVIPALARDAAEEPETVLETATVTVGDLSITADGTGVLVASAEVDLTFGANGTLTELLVEVGDRVEAGDVLAWIDDTDARKAVVDAELSVLQAQEALDNAVDKAKLEQAVAQAELKVAQAENNLATAKTDLDDLVNWAPDETEVEVAQANLAINQASYENTVAKANMRDDQIASTRIKLEEAIRDLEEAQANYANAMDAARDWERNIDVQRENAAKSLQKAHDNLEVAQASYNLAMIDSSAIDVANARVKVLNAEQALEDLLTEPDEEEIAAARLKVQELEVALQQARLDLSEAQEALSDADDAQAKLSLEQAQLKLASAQETLEGVSLVAPISGTVIEVKAEVGEKVSGAVVVLANLRQPVIQFWVEESDMGSVSEGSKVNVVFEALPDLVYPGEITRIDPQLVTVSNTSAVQAWASIETGVHPVNLLGEMNVEVEVVAGEAKNAVLAPIQALRELGEDQYAVFVVKDDGELEMRIVEVGLRDYVNAEILSGLQRGEVVSTGEKTSSSSSSSSSSDSAPPDQPPPGGVMRFMGG
jgi:RND family efflux transporter MFP subunit